MDAPADPTRCRWAAEVRKHNFDGSLQWSRVFDGDTTPCGHPIFSLTSHRGHVSVIGQIDEWALTSCKDQPYGQSYIVGPLQNLDAGGNTVWQRRIKAGIPGTEGGSGIDPTTPSGRVQLIVGQIETLSDAGRMSSGDFTALVGHLESALAALDRSNANVAKASLQAFVSLVDSYRTSGRLTSAEAGALIAAATAIAGEL